MGAERKAIGHTHIRDGHMIKSEDNWLILNLIGQYNRCLDNDDFPAWIQTFHENGVIETPSDYFNQPEGLLEFAQSFRQDFKDTQHWLNKVALEEQQAQIIAKSNVWIIDPSSRARILAIDFFDQLIFENGQWKFFHRKANFLFTLHHSSGQAIERNILRYS